MSTKRILTGIIFLLSGVSQAYALDYLSLNQVCRRIENPTIRSECYGLGAYGASFDGFACGVCDRIESAQVTVECLREVHSRTFQYAALEICDSLQSAKRTVQCMRRIAWKTYAIYEIRYCRSLSGDQAKLDCL